MADLHNLLGEVLEPQAQEFEGENEEWAQDREHLALPSVLAEAERRKRNETSDTADEERLELGDVYGHKNAEVESMYTKLQAWWTQELLAPEILPYDSDAVQAMTDAIHDHDEKMARLQGAEDSSGNAHLDALMGRILKIDSDRAKFLLCGLLKRRLAKIEEFPLHMRENLDRLSNEETAFLKEYGSLFEQHLRRTVLDHFPQEDFRKLDESEMIDEPDLETYLFVRCKDEVLIDNTMDNTPPDLHEKGSTLIVRYSRIRDLFLEGKVELLM